MRDEPVIGCCEKSPSLVFWRRRAAPPALARGRATARPRASVFAFEREGFGAVGKWKTCFWFSTFPSALVVGAVGMWESRLPLARFPRGSWKEWEACLLAFHAFHSPGISTALSQCFSDLLRHPAQRRGRSPESRL